MPPPPLFQTAVSVSGSWQRPCERFCRSRMRRSARGLRRAWRMSPRSLPPHVSSCRAQEVDEERVNKGLCALGIVEGRARATVSVRFCLAEALQAGDPKGLARCAPAGRSAPRASELEAYPWFDFGVQVDTSPPCSTAEAAPAAVLCAPCGCCPRARARRASAMARQGPHGARGAARGAPAVVPAAPVQPVHDHARVGRAARAGAPGLPRRAAGGAAGAPQRPGLRAGAAKGARRAMHAPACAAAWHPSRAAAPCRPKLARF